MSRRPFRSISSNSGRTGPRRVFSLLAVAALLTGALLAWALPALARSGRHGPGALASVPTTTDTLAQTVTRTPTRTLVTPTRTIVSPAGTASTGPAGAAKPPRSWVGRWGRTFTVMAPVASDLIAPIVGVSATGQIAVGAGTTDEDAPQNARASVLTGTSSNVFTKHGLSQTQQTLAVGYLADRLVLLLGTSPKTEPCCSVASVVAYDSAGAFGNAEQFATGLEGTSIGALVPVSGGLLAAVDNQAGITVSRSDAQGDFGNSEQLVAGDPTPPLMATAPLADGGAVVAWTAPAMTAQTVTGTSTSPGSSTTASGYDQPTNQLIYFDLAAPTGLPGEPKLAVRVPAGREIDALTVAAHRTGATLAWTESWYSGSQYYSEVFWADLRARAVVSELSPASTVAVGLSMASSTKGRQVLTWQACNVGAGTCTADAVLRPHGDAWGAVRVLGEADPTSFPVATQSRLGQSLIGWISNGFVTARAARPAGTGFYPAARVSDLAGATDLALGFGAGQKAVAVWIQGTVNQKLTGSRFTP
jgi:hypothetical protein